MNTEKAKRLRAGQRVKWQPLEPTPTTETGKVTQNTGKHVRIRWDDEDFDRIYPVEGEPDRGLTHVEVIK